MHRVPKFLIFCIILLSFSKANAEIYSLNRKKIITGSVIPPMIPLPAPGFIPATGGPSVFGIDLSKEITPINDCIRSIQFSDMPEEYDIWSNSHINPYQVNLADMKDTVLIDLSGYYPPSQKYITSNFGFRKWRFHYGIDLKVHKGDSVYNAFDGVVRITQRARGYGYFVLVRHNNGLETLYAHLNKITVKPGDTIKSGIPLGLGGSTGRSTGYHLHFEVRYLGNPINPSDIIDFENPGIRNQILALNAQHFEYKKEIDKIRYWTVRKGDTLSKIAQKTGISVSKLCTLNGIKKTTILSIGRRIRYT